MLFVSTGTNILYSSIFTNVVQKRVPTQQFPILKNIQTVLQNKKCVQSTVAFSINSQIQLVRYVCSSYSHQERCFHYLIRFTHYYLSCLYHESLFFSTNVHFFSVHLSILFNGLFFHFTACAKGNEFLNTLVTLHFILWKCHIHMIITFVHFYVHCEHVYIHAHMYVPAHDYVGILFNNPTQHSTSRPFHRINVKSTVQ